MSSPVRQTLQKKVPRDFTFAKIVGEVLLAFSNVDFKPFAIKVLNKKHIIKYNKIKATMREKEIYSKLKNELIIKLFCTFQDTNYLYFVMNYATGGDLCTLLKSCIKFSKKVAEFYLGEIVVAVRYLQNNGIIHRDLKPDNIVLNYNGHIILTDFGAAIAVPQKYKPQSDNSSPDTSSNDSTKQRDNTFAGTVQYIAPEHLTKRISTFEIDIWAIGIMAFEFLTGVRPFPAPHEYGIMTKIITGVFEIPDYIDEISANLITGLLQVEPEKRLGYECIENIIIHPFFSHFDFENYLQMEPPFSFPDEISTQELIKYKSFPLGLSNSHLSLLLSHQVTNIPNNKTPAEKSRTDSKESLENYESNFSIIESFIENDKKRLADILHQQSLIDKFHGFSYNQLILKQGILDKRVKLFSKTRRFLILTGPKIIYIDESTMSKKGEIKWTKQLKATAKNFSVFNIHVPNRIYHLIDKNSKALEWVDIINKIHNFYFDASSSLSDKSLTGKIKNITLC